MGRNLYDVNVDDCAWQVLPAGFDTDDLDHKGWVEPELTTHGIYLPGRDPDFMIVGSRTALLEWLRDAQEQVQLLPPDQRRPDGSLAARVVDPAWAQRPGTCPPPA